MLPADGAAVWPVQQAARGESVLVELDGAPFAELPTGDWPEPPLQALVVPLMQQGGTSQRVPGGRAEPVPPGEREEHRLRRAGRRTYRCGNRQRPQLPGPAAAGRGAGRAGPRQDHVLLQHQPRVPHPADVDPRPRRRAARPGSGLDDETREELDVVWRNGLRLSKLVNTLLDFSRIEAGRAQARYEPVDLAAVTAELASVFRSAVDRAGLDFTVDCPALDEPVYIDRDMWEKVVLNLLSQRAEVHLRRVHLGRGAPRGRRRGRHRRRHRDRCGRRRRCRGCSSGSTASRPPARAPTRAAASGWPWCKELVGLHGGTITADSAEGAGTTFTIRLPFGTAHLPADAVASTAGTRAASGVAEPYVQEALRWMPGDDADAAEVADRR